MIWAVHRLPAKCVAYMGIVWADRRKNTHTQPITRHLWDVFIQSGSFMSVLSVFLLSVYACTKVCYSSLTTRTRPGKFEVPSDFLTLDGNSMIPEDLVVLGEGALQIRVSKKH